MKVCPVCEMEEEDSALSCSMCGSDFEPSVKEVPDLGKPIINIKFLWKII